MNALFNLIILLVLIVGGLFAYAEYNDDEEFKAKIYYYVNNIVYVAQEQYQEWRQDAKDAANDTKRDTGNMIRDAASQLRR